MSGAPSTFGGYASHPSLGEEPVPGTIVFEYWRLRFGSESMALEVPLTRLGIDMDKESGRIDFYDPQQPDLVIYTLDEEILKHPALLQQAHTRRQIEALQSADELKRRLKLTGLFLVGFAVLAVVVSTLLGVMVRSLVAAVPPQWEQELGDNVMPELKKHLVVVEDKKLKAKLDQAVLPLVNTLPTNYGPFKFYIVQDRFPNAFALPGGHVIVNTALIDMADKPEEVCGVVAHEIAHVTQKHGIRKIISEAGPFLVFKLFVSDRSGVFGVLGSGSKLLVSQSFSQEYELEADSVGWDYLVKAHIDPRGMVDMFHKLKLMQDNMGTEALSVSAFESHPQTEKRIQRLEAKWDRLKDKTDFVTLENSEWK